MKFFSVILGLLLTPATAVLAGSIDLELGGSGTASTASGVFPGTQIIGFEFPPEMALPRGQNQLMLELINHARANPAAEAARLGIDLNDGLPPLTISNDSKPPLAAISPLSGAALEQAGHMAYSGTLKSTNSFGFDLTRRVQIWGYPVSASWGVEEAIDKLPSQGETNATRVAEKLHEQLFRNAEARRKMLDPDYDETGIRMSAFGGSDIGLPPFGDIYISEIFGFSSGSPASEGPYVLGVAYCDKNGNGSYDTDEGLPGVSVALFPGKASALTDEEGGFSIPRGRAKGKIKVTFSGTGIQNSMVVSAQAEKGQNLKVDLRIPPATNPSPSISFKGKLNFGNVAVGTMDTRPITITNTGNVPVKFTALSQGDRFGAVVYTPLAVGASQTVNVVFSPLAAQAYSGTFTLTSDAGTIKIPQSGRGVVLPLLEAPMITPSGGGFNTSVTVKIDSLQKRTTIRYTTDGSTPTEKSPKYTKPFVLRQSAEVRAKAFKIGFTESPTASATFTKIGIP